MKRIYAGILMISICMLTGCSLGPNKAYEDRDAASDATSDEASDVASDTDGIEAVDTVSFPDSYHYESEKLKIAIENIKAYESQFIRGTQELSEKIDYEAIIKDFFPMDEEHTYIESDEGIELRRKEETSVDQEYACAYSHFCRYWSKEDVYYVNCVKPYKNDPWNNLIKYSDEKTFGFGSADEARKAVGDIFLKYGIDLENDFICTVYYLDYETMSGEENHEDISGKNKDYLYKDSWTEEDNAYLFYYQQKYCDLPYCDVISSKNIGVENSPIRVTYNKDGIAGFDISYLRDFFVGDEVVQLMSFDEIIEEVKTYFESIVDDHKYTVVEAELISDYMDAYSGHSEVIPVWAFYYQEHDPELPDYAGYYTLRINAETGQIVEHTEGAF